MKQLETLLKHDPKYMKFNNNDLSYGILGAGASYDVCHVWLYYFYVFSSLVDTIEHLWSILPSASLHWLHYKASKETWAHQNYKSQRAPRSYN